MKNVIVALILGLSLSVNAQNSPKGNLEATSVKSVETTDNQTTKASNKVSNNSTPVVVNSTRSVDNDQPRRDTSTENDYGDDFTPTVQYRTEPRQRKTYQGPARVAPCYTLYEINTRPMTDLQGYFNLGLELSTGCKSSLLFDVSSGTNTFLDLQVSSAMIGFRSYTRRNMTGGYVTARARGRSYDNRSAYGGNISLMYGWKTLLEGGISIAMEGGLGYQGVDGIYGPLPTWAVTVGYRL